jgi:hypothetical protein
MKRTVVNIESSFDKINQNQRFVFLGSCFANNIGDHFIHYKLKSIVNPLGVVFHPISLMRLIDRSINENWFTEKDFFEFDSYWFNYELSGTCAKASLKSAITFANNQLVELRSSILNADRLFLTFGSAIGYIKNGEIVANCHKQDGSLFAKKNFKEECLFNIVKSNLELLIKINKNIRVHLTVSPVRHKKEGIVENSRSKATLINLAHNLSDYYPEVEYFPAYEIVVDELRDYQYFNNDLVHPNLNAINIIWNKLLETLATKDLNEFVEKSRQLNKSVKHRSLHPKSISNKNFLKKLLSKLYDFQKETNTSWSTEIEEVELILKSLN